MNTNTSTTSRRPVATALAALLAGGAAVLAAPAPHASAQAAVITDPSGDLRGVTQDYHGDITKVRTTHGRHNLRVTVRAADDGGVADLYLAYVDTDPADPGPEYAIGAGAETETAQVSRVDDWQLGSGRHVRCPGTAADFGFEEADNRVTLTIPRSCLGRPDKLRVAVATAPDYPYKRIDWAPGVKKLGPSLVSGPVG